MRDSAAPPVGRLAGRLTRSLSRVETEAAEKTNALGFSGVSVGARDFVLARAAPDRRSQMDGKQRVGLNEAQAGGENAGPSLRYFNIRAAAW
jgi:hypothetical protein